MSRNYPNMSYCAFENTNAAIQQIINLIDDKLENDSQFTLQELVDTRSSSHEKKAVNNLIENMEQLLSTLKLIDKDQSDDDEEDIDWEDEESEVK